MTFRLKGFACTASALAALAMAMALPSAQGTDTPPQPKFTVPAGFEVVRVAGPPLVDRPIVADFDEQGRLYVADSSGSNDKVEKQLADRPHRIVRLEDKDGDGAFDTSVVFADRMMLPQGAMWLDGSLYVGAPPSIWKLTDTNDDGVADTREEWFAGKTLTGCANDLHGPYLGPDGWIYWTKGAFAEQTYERPGKPPLVTRAAHIFRRRPGRHTGGVGDRRRHGQPHRRGLHTEWRGDAHGDLPRASTAGAPRCVHSRGLRRAVWQAARRHRQTTRRPAISCRRSAISAPRRSRVSPVTRHARSARGIATISLPRCSTCRR